MKTTLPSLLAGACLALSAAGTLAAPASYATPEAAVAAAVAALESRDRDALLAVFGPENEDLIRSGDPEQDREDRRDFLAAHAEMHRVAVAEDGSATLYVGADQWPFPIRLAKGETGWAFDVEAGRQEILERRIGRNELDVIELLRAYAKVQARYRQSDRDGDGVREFAAHIISTPGSRDGLYWPPADDAPESPVGEAVAMAAAEGYVIDGEARAPEPYLGYYFHLLRKQGESAPGGAFDYRVNGNMVAGHALLAFPSAYGETGVMSFVIAENGVVHEADFGEDTIAAASAIDSFDPGEGWAPVAPE